mgnify:CR=1 FL=1
MEQVFFNVPLSKLEPIFKRWIKEAQAEIQPTKVEPTEQSQQWLDLNDLVKYDPEKRKKPTWYSKISRQEVPHYKRGKKVYFLKSEIDEWLKQGRKKSNAEIEQKAEAYLSNNKKGLK